MDTNNTRKRILIFSTAYYPFVGGAEVAIKEITDRLDGDFDFDLITARMDKKLPTSEKIGSVSVHRIGSGSVFWDKLFLPLRGSKLALQLEREHQYFCFWSVMVSFAALGGYLANMIRVLSGRKKVPMVLTLQEGDSENHLNFKWGGLLFLSWKIALWNTNVLTAISNFLLHMGERKGFKGKSFLVPNGVDIKVFSEKVSDDEKEKINKELERKPNEIFVVTSSRLTKKNGVDDLIRSIELLPENISLIILGRGEEGHHLQNLVNKLKIKDRVKFLGFVPQPLLPKYLSVCDVFVRPSRSEGFGNSFIEAMAVGLPVVATPVGGIPDFLDDKETGVFASPDNPQSVKVAILSIINDPVLRSKIVQNAQKRVTERYSWERVANLMKGAFDSIN